MGSSEKLTKLEKHAPVSLPAGSYDRSKLAEGLEAAIDRQDGNRQAEVDKAVSTATRRVKGAAAAETNPAALPDHKFVKVDAETIQIFDPDKADKHIPAMQPVVPGRGASSEEIEPPATKTASAASKKE